MAQISFSFSGGFWPSSLPLFHGVTRPLVFVAVSMSRSSVEGKELHVDPGRRALVDPKPPSRLTKTGRSTSHTSGRTPLRDGLVLWAIVMMKGLPISVTGRRSRGMAALTSDERFDWP